MLFIAIVSENEKSNGISVKSLWSYRNEHLWTGLFPWGLILLDQCTSDTYIYQKVVNPVKEWN